MIDNFITLLADALEKDSSDVNMDDEFRNYEEWDSLAVLAVIAMIKTNYNITIPRKDFDELKTVSELYEYIQAHR
jgi:acyl carrier protein